MIDTKKDIKEMILRNGKKRKVGMMKKKLHLMKIKKKFKSKLTRASQ